MNRAIGASYEPGSVFKIITAAAALERGRVGFSELFDCSAGFIRVGGTVITDHDRERVLSFPRSSSSRPTSERSNSPSASASSSSARRSRPSASGRRRGSTCRPRSPAVSSRQKMDQK